jgi:hypothetical protein
MRTWTHGVAALWVVLSTGCPAQSQKEDPTASPSITASAAPSAAPTGPAASAERPEREADVFALLGGEGARALPTRPTSSGLPFDPSLRGRLTIDPWFVEVRLVVKAEGVPLPAVRRVLDEQKDVFAYCYGLGYRDNPNLMGGVTARFELGAAGPEHMTHEADLNDAAAVACVVERLGKMTFPRPAAPPAQLEVRLMFVPR